MAFKRVIIGNQTKLLCNLRDSQRQIDLSRLLNLLLLWRHLVLVLLVLGVVGRLSWLWMRQVTERELRKLTLYKIYLLWIGALGCQHFFIDIF